MRSAARNLWVCSETAARPWGAQQPHDADALACSLRIALDRTAGPLARAAAAFVEARGWEPFGFARLEDYARERLSRSGRWLKDMAALGRALGSLSGLDRALEGSGGSPSLGRVACILIARVATPDSLQAWVDLARRATVRELRDAVRQARAARSSTPLEGSAAPVPDADLENIDDADDVVLRLEVPPSVAAAFDEALELFRAVEGHEASVRSFVEALVADSWAGPGNRRLGHGGADTGDAAGDGLRHLQHGTGCDVIEEALARSTGRWAHLRARPDDSDAEAIRILARLAALRVRAGQGDPAELDAQIRELISLEDDLERRLGEVLAGMAERGAWSRLKFAGAGHYAEQRLGLSRTAMRDRVRVARALRQMPLVSEAYQDGQLSLEATRHIVRILMDQEPSAEAQQLWIDRGRRATVKRIKDEVRALVRARIEHGGAWPPAEPLDDAAWHASLERRAGMARDRMERYQAMAATCRGVSNVFLSLRLPAELARDLLGTMEFAGALVGDRMPQWYGLLMLLMDFVETWDESPERESAPIYERDGYRCMAPGCTSRRNLEDHHVLYRSRGGGNEQDNRICLCRFHHQRGEHGGLTTCRGRAPLGVVWKMGLSGGYRSEIRLNR